MAQRINGRVLGGLEFASEADRKVPPTKGCLKCHEQCNVVFIEPFDPNNLSGSAPSVSLAEHGVASHSATGLGVQEAECLLRNSLMGVLMTG